ncbi:Ricin-type beta-trefoil lectin domain-like [Pedobacter soli]|uniref:Ricin-type beta-trefoil lectin domain-like n=2 Tax=Pedobacter soli TaxID=390242 RepID=A0A1G6S7X9_9SPHI|nr:Ricin-type beta-trefoil lectin domain-like [Pedobacter soli]
MITKSLLNIMKTKPSILRSIGAVMLGIVLFSSSCKKDKLSDTTTTESLSIKGKLGAIPPNEAQLTVANGTFYIVNRKSGKVLDVAAFQTADGANVAQYAGTGGTNQKWTLTAVSGGYYSVIGVHSAKALQVDQAGTADGDNVNISTNTGATNQQWQFTSIGNGYYRIINRNSGKDLDVAGQSIDNSANVDQWTYWGGENQQWSLLTVNASGQLGWTLTSTGVPADVLTRITNAMNDACARYNAGANWPARTLTVEYNTGVATADGSTNGNIRFGANTSYQNVRTAMHEIAHTYGVGLSGGWGTNTSTGDFLGTNTVALVKIFDGTSGAIHTGGGHFWPYGLNYDNEWSETNAFRHVKLVYAMRSDGM